MAKKPRKRRDPYAIPPLDIPVPKMIAYKRREAGYRERYKCKKCKRRTCHFINAEYSDKDILRCNVCGTDKYFYKQKIGVSRKPGDRQELIFKYLQRKVEKTDEDMNLILQFLISSDFPVDKMIDTLEEYR